MSKISRRDLLIAGAALGGSVLIAGAYLGRSSQVSSSTSTQSSLVTTSSGNPNAGDGETSSVTSDAASSNTLSVTSNTTSNNTSSNSPSESSSSTASTDTSSSTNPSRPSYYDILRAHGVTTQGIVAYGEPMAGSVYPFASDSSVVDYYNSLGFTIYPIQDGSSGYTSYMQTTYTDWSSVGGGVLAPSDGWGYNTGIHFDAATLYPQDQEFYLSNGTLVPATSHGILGVVIDSPGYLALWNQLYDELDADIGLQNFIGGPADWLNSDHPVNYGGASGMDGGHNMNTYVRYVNDTIGAYLGDVDPSGVHLRDGTSCPLWYLRGDSPNYSATTCKPTIALATDVSVYHHMTSSSGSISQASSFSEYCATANARLEYSLYQRIAAKTPYVLARTAIPLQYLANVPDYYNSPLEVMAGSDDFSNAFAVMQRFGGEIMCVPYFNFNNDDDNSSNPQGGYGAATEATIQSFFCGTVPFISHWPLIEADSQVSDIQSNGGAFEKYGSQFKMPLVGGWPGYNADRFYALVIDPYYDNSQTLSIIGSTAFRMWGMASSDDFDNFEKESNGMTLSDYDVILGWPDNTADQENLTNWVQSGGTLILYNGSGAPESLTSGADIPSNHPITQPYSPLEVAAIFSNGIGTITTVGSGKVIQFNRYGYGDGLSIGGTSNGEGGSDSVASGLAYLTLSAMNWAVGQPTGAIYTTDGTPEGNPKYFQRLPFATPLNSSGEGGFSGIGIHIKSGGSGNKIIWISNASSNTVMVPLGLSRSFYGFGTSWSFQDLATGQTYTGSGDVNLAVSVPAYGWSILLGN